MKEIEAWFDGCCEPYNPGGHASFGVLIKWGGEVIVSESGYCGYGRGMSNNVAEFSGVIRILEYLTCRAEHATIRGDSKLVINLLRGKWQARKGLYIPYYRRAVELYKENGGKRKISLFWIPREENGECDVLSKKVLKDRGVTFRLQPEN